MRFAVQIEVRYRRIGAWRESGGSGQTVNVNSSGILIRSAHPAQPQVRVGTRAEATLAWPILLNKVTQLKLFVTGSVIRLEDSTFALSIESYQFRTMKRNQTRIPADSRGALALVAGRG